MGSCDFRTISIIIVNFNGLSHLEACLESIEKSNYPMEFIEVIVVDNGSTDGSVDYLKKNHPNVKLIILDKNYGFCLPNNLGAKSATGDYLFLLNNDTVIDQDCLINLCKAIDFYEKKGAVVYGPKVLYYDKRDLIQVAGGTLSVIGFGYYIGDRDKDGPKYDVERFVGFATGAATLVKKDFFLGVGGYDETYFASAEEAELGFHAWLRGFKLIYIPCAKVYHKVSITYGRRGPTPLKVFLQTKNRIVNIFKFLNAENVVVGLFISFLLDFTRLLLYAFMLRSPKCCLSILNAYIWILKNMHFYRRKRSDLRIFKRISENSLPKPNVFSPLKDCLREELRLRKIWKSFHSERSRQH